MNHASGRSALAAVIAAVLLIGGAVGAALLFSGGGSAAAAGAPAKTVTATVTATATQTVTATATVPGPTTTATVTETATVPGPTQTVTATETATVPGPTSTVTVTETAACITPTPTATTTPPAPKTALFGAYPGTSSSTDTSTWATREARVTAEFGGKLGGERRFMSTNFTAPTYPSTSMVYSWDFPVAATLAGTYDAQIDAIARGATKTLFFSVWHEVDNGPKVPPADYVNLFRYIANRVHAVGNPLVKMATLNMAYTTRTGDLTTWNSMYPGDAYVDVIGFDVYINPGIATLDTVDEGYQYPIAIAKAHGKPLLIGETSFYPGYTDAQWTTMVQRIIDLTDTPDTAAVIWFESNKSDGDWRLLNHPDALAEWSAVASR